MAKIAAVSKRSPAGRPQSRMLASGQGWSVSEVACDLGPEDHPFEEQHSRASVSIVTAGTFQYRSRNGVELMTPGSLMLGSPGQLFECGHEHGAGDHCISFSYDDEFFGRLQADAGVHAGKGRFKALRLPPLRCLSPLVARVCAALGNYREAPWHELGIQLAARAVQFDGGIPAQTDVQAGPLARVTRVIRMIESHPGDVYALRDLALQAHLSPYHFLRTFRSLTAVTPHQYLLRLRLRRAALRLGNEPAKIVDIALECGFGDISNFNRTFRAEFGFSPRAYRRRIRQ